MFLTQSFVGDTTDDGAPLPQLTSTPRISTSQAASVSLSTDSVPLLSTPLSPHSKRRISPIQDHPPPQEPPLRPQQPRQPTSKPSSEKLTPSRRDQGQHRLGSSNGDPVSLRPSLPPRPLAT